MRREQLLQNYFKSIFCEEKSEPNASVLANMTQVDVSLTDYGLAVERMCFVSLITQFRSAATSLREAFGGSFPLDAIAQSFRPAHGGLARSVSAHTAE
jgi:hypothetical protein